MQEHIRVNLPKGKKVPYTDYYSQLAGTLHVNIQRENGVIVSVYQMDPDRVAGMSSPFQPAALQALNYATFIAWTATFFLGLSMLYKWLVNYRR